MKKRSIIFSLFSLILFFSILGSFNASANEVQNGSVTSVSVNREALNELSFKTQKNLQNLMKQSMRKASVVKTGERKIIPINDEVYAEIEVYSTNPFDNYMIGIASATSRASSRVFSAQGSYYLKNIFNKTIVTLTAHGVFKINGSSVKAIDAYGTYNGFIWDISSNSNMVNNIARTSFRCTFDIGIDPVSMRIQTVNIMGSLIGYNNGTASIKWG